MWLKKKKIHNFNEVKECEKCGRHSFYKKGLNSEYCLKIECYCGYYWFERTKDWRES